MHAPSVSVIIPHYGDPRPTLNLISQLRPQRTHEIFVVDDHSPEPFPSCDGVQVIRRNSNGGFGATVNTGAAFATLDLLLILNSDLAVPVDLIERLVDAERVAHPCVVGPRVLDARGRVTISARRWPTTLHQAAEWLTPLARWRDRDWMRRLLGHDTRVLDAREPIDVDWLVGAALMVPRDEFADVGGFDERFFMNSEEIDLQRRLARRGVRRRYVPGVSVTHEGGGSSDPAKRRRWLVQGQLRYSAKWGGRRRLRSALVVATVVNLSWNMVRRLRGIPVDPLATAREELSLARSAT
ncbi:hypothetical protein TESS_TESS_00660 [Tessaracoccus sp. O5.2]